MRLRFNLGRGNNYMKWKLSGENMTTEFYDPYNCSLSLANCKLVNQAGTAKKIHEGANKQVCAWISCDFAERIPSQTQKTVGDMREVYYNPRVAPYWRDKDGNNLDGKEFSRIITIGKKVFVS